VHSTRSDKVYQLLVHGRWFSPGIPASTTKTGCHDIAEILLKVALNTINQIKLNLIQNKIKLKIKIKNLKTITSGTQLLLSVYNFYNVRFTTSGFQPPVHNIRFSTRTNFRFTTSGLYGL